MLRALSVDREPSLRYILKPNAPYEVFVRELDLKVPRPGRKTRRLYRFNHVEKPLLKGQGPKAILRTRI